MYTWAFWILLNDASSKLYPFPPCPALHCPRPAAACLSSHPRLRDTCDASISYSML